MKFSRVTRQSIGFVATAVQRLLNVSVLGSVLALIAFPSSTNAFSTSSVCDELRRVLDHRQPGKKDPLWIPSRSLGGGDTEYLNLDVDGDGVADHVLRSCGSPSMPCDLFIDLSSGRKLELEEERFFVGKYKSRLYVIVGGHYTRHRIKPETGKRKIYQITGSGIKLVCPSI